MLLYADRVLKLRFLRRKRRPADPEDSEPAFPPRRALKPGDSSETDQPSNVRYQEYQRDPLGLTVLFKPDRISPSVDIIFVHGLRGRSMRTWSLDDDLKLFWPQKWLPDGSYHEILLLRYAGAASPTLLAKAAISKQCLPGTRPVPAPVVPVVSFSGGATTPR